MLTKDDLRQIENITRKTTKQIVREEIKAEGKNIRTDLKAEINLLGEKTTSEFKKVNYKLANLDTQIKKVQKDLRKTSNFLDKENLRTLRRVRIIEEHLNIPEPQLA